MKQLKGFKLGATLKDKLKLQIAIIFQYLLSKLFKKQVSIHLSGD